MNLGQSVTYVPGYTRFAPFPQQAVRSGFGKVVVVVRNILTKVVSEILINF
jgi:hypothetical protein